MLARAWQAGAGPGDSPLTIDLDSTICETYGLAKEGARQHGYTGKRGYHPLLAVAAGTGEVLMSRLREGRANTVRGAAHFLRETVGRVRYGGGYHPLLAVAAGTGEVLMSRLREGRANTVRGAAHFLRETVGRVRYGGARDNSRCGPTVASMPTPWSRSAARWMSACPSPSSSTPACPPARLRNLIEAIPETDWTPIPYWMDGTADVTETTYTPFQSEPDAAPVRLIVRRVKPTPGSQLALFASYSYHGFITDRDGEMLELEADHRRHAEIENAIRDLKYGVGLNNLPSGRFAANGAWLAVQVMAHNLARWTVRIGLGEQIVTTKTLRRRVFALAGRHAASPCICHSAGLGKPSSVAPWPDCEPFHFQPDGAVCH